MKSTPLPLFIRSQYVSTYGSRTPAGDRRMGLRCSGCSCEQERVSKIGSASDYALEVQWAREFHAAHLHREFEYANR